jgi:hypothetical protein
LLLCTRHHIVDHSTPTQLFNEILDHDDLNQAANIERKILFNESG